jgi:tetratricopeptide (TPR) repeat protein
MIGICGLVIDSVAATPADRIHALLARAELRRKSEQFDLAVQDCSEAIRLDPAAPQGFDCRGNALAADKKYLPALDDFDRSIKLDPEYVQGFADRAATFGLMRETRLAVRDYTEAVRLDPTRVQGFVDRAEAYLKVRRIDLAIDDQSEAIRLEPSSPDHFEARGKLYARNSAYDRAIADFNEAIRLEPKAGYFVERGNAYNLKGNSDRAGRHRACADRFPDRADDGSGARYCRGASRTAQAIGCADGETIGSAPSAGQRGGGVAQVINPYQALASSRPGTRAPKGRPHPEGARTCARLEGWSRGHGSRRR